MLFLFFKHNTYVLKAIIVLSRLSDSWENTELRPTLINFAGQGIVNIC
jgi:hypothetical protein